MLRLLLVTAAADAQLLLFSSTQTFDGARGDRIETNDLCATFNDYDALACHSATMLASYTDDQARDLDVNQSAPILGPTGLFIAANFSVLFSGAPIAQSLETAAVLPGGVGWWSGSTAVGSLGANCDDFTMAGATCVSGAIGASSQTATAWVAQPQLSLCATRRYVVCLGVGCTPRTSDAPTRSPSTSKPSLSPSHAPSASPGHFGIRLYDSAATTANILGAYGSYAGAATALCPASPSCVGSPTIILCTYNESEFQRVPIALNVNPSMPVYGPTGIIIAPSWNQLFNVPTIGDNTGPPYNFPNPYYQPSIPPKSALTSTVYAAGITTSHWLGCYANLVGVTSRSTFNENCANFTTTSGLSDASLDGPGPGPTGLVNQLTDADDGSCDLTFPVYCACKVAVPPTAAPTHSPSKTPTTSRPSKSPSHAPTRSPTPPLGIHFYSDGIARQGDLGPRYVTDALCNAMTTYPEACNSGTGHAILCYNGSDNVRLFPTLYGFNASTTRVYGPTTSTVIRSSWANLFIASGGQFLDISLQDAGVYSTPSEDYYGVPSMYTGCGTFGSVTSTCNKWTDNTGIILGQTGDMTTTVAWISANTPVCSSSYGVVCMCMGTKNITLAPTPQPTQAPTHSPTKSPKSAAPSRAPTASPTPHAVGVHFYSDGTPRPAILGPRYVTDATCNAMSTYPEACAAGLGHAMISYNGSDQISQFASRYHIPPTVPIYGPTTSTVISSSWGYTFSPGPALRLTGLSLVDAGVAFSPGDDYYGIGPYMWSGATVLGGVDAASNCGQWTSTSTELYGGPRIGDMTSRGSTWISTFSSPYCNATFALVCMCYGTKNTTLAPTPNPSRTPTRTPTNSPQSSAPSRTPTNSPTLDPARVYIYELSPTARPSGALGTQAATDAACLASANKPSECTSAHSLLCYSARTISQFTALYGISAASRVYGPTHSVIANNWTALLAGNLVRSMQAAGVTSRATAWIGCTTFGVTGNNCLEWASGTSINLGNVGSMTSTTNTWLQTTTSPCSVVVDTMLCACAIQPPTPAPTKSPSKSPTRTPSRAPTTSRPSFAPTHSPSPIATGLHFYSDGIARLGDLGPRYVTDALCNAMTTYPEACAAGLGHALLCYNGSDNVHLFPTLYGFNASTTRVYGPTTSTVIRSSWANLFIASGGQFLDISLQDAGVYSTPSEDYYGVPSMYTGCGTFGSVTSTCNKWTDNTGIILGQTGDMTTTLGSWISANTPVCSSSYGVVCMCMGTKNVTLSPTPPTQSPV